MSLLYNLMVMSVIKKFYIGFIIGLAKIIPGVSGSVMAMSFGVYEDLIECLSNPLVILKNKNVLVVLIGIIFAIFLGSGFIAFFLEYYFVQSMSLFIGLMMYGLVPIVKSSIHDRYTKKDISYALIACFICTSLLLVRGVSTNVSYIYDLRLVMSLFLCGILDAFSSIVPGISGTALLMMVGYYDLIINSVTNAKIIMPFLVGLCVGVVSISKIINYMIKNYKSRVNLCVIYFIVFSCISLLIRVFGVIKSNDVIVSVFLLILGFILSYLMDTKWK